MRAAVSLDPTRLRSRDGNLFVANSGANNILKFDPAGNATVFADASSGLSSMRDLAFDREGNLLVANRLGPGLTGNILRFDPSGTASVFADTNDGVVDPAGLAFDASGRLFMTNQSGHNILEFDPAGNASVFASDLFFPDDLTFAAGGDLFVTNLGPRNILRFGAAGNRTIFASLEVALALGSDTAGNLLAESQFENSSSPVRVLRFDTAGNASVVAVLGSGTGIAGGLAVQPSAAVPEPSTAALLVLGAGFMFVHIRRRTAQ
jgi:DNA-binding beta-propeller fold protein YncE